MSKTPFPDQILPPDHLTFVRGNVQKGKAVAGDDLLLAIEQCLQQPMPENVRDLVRQSIIPAEAARGRPSKFGAALDLALETVDRRYPALLHYEARKKSNLRHSGKLAVKGESPAMHAYSRLLQHMKSEFGPMTWEALKNMHSRWRNGHFHFVGNAVDSSDFDAEIERLFPPPHRSS